MKHVSIIGEVQEFIRSSGVKPIDLAKASGLTRGQISKIVNGKVADVSSANADILRLVMKMFKNMKEEREKNGLST